MTHDAFIFSLNMALAGLIVFVLIGALLAVGMDKLWEDHDD
jgi:ABC-type spermidine/putrescine transport system permease subunit II